MLMLICLVCITSHLTCCCISSIALFIFVAAGTIGDDMEAVVLRNVDPSLQRTYSDGSPVVLSGVSGGNQGSITHSTSSQIEGTGYKCTVCKNKFLKTKRGLLNHIFLHNMAGKV